MNDTLEGDEYLNSLAIWDGKKQDFSLDRIRRVMSDLGDPQDKTRTIIVGGTNGKGSVSAFLSAIMAQAGNSVGVNISPHLISVRERIVVNGASISKDDFNYLSRELRKVIEKLDTVLTFHEFLTALALFTFAEKKVDWTVLEVGVGGRLDSANIVKNPHVSCIVSIDYDHQQLLGRTLLEIAAEKLGIVRKNGLLVTGRFNQEVTDAVGRFCKQNNVRHLSLGREFHVNVKGDKEDTKNIGELSCEFRSGGSEKFDYRPGLLGRHQVDNSGIAIAIAESLGVEIQDCKKGVEKVFWPGRLEWCKYYNLLILLDCAHNPAGIRSLVDYLISRKSSSIDIAFAAIPSKNWREMVSLLIPFTKQFLLLEPETAPGVAMEEMGEYLSSFGVRTRIFGRDYDGFLKFIRSECQEVVITGSIYMIGGIRRRVVPGEIRLW